eukprot:CAMPEP_0115651900 /NCGR_PEP_ID=MMETSP0272-20121206/41790_1 /TAXON_ID=71861 /ORGANISM="Scrippsiella trochoidea, Strain CCMP3099" /LENGTH=207 /DNA_ID=CAMNT_0003089685 /DNA_START=76 /DNA_END=695 /DNA_ORIENTATION=-
MPCASTLPLSKLSPLIAAGRPPPSEVATALPLLPPSAHSSGSRRSTSGPLHERTLPQDDVTMAAAAGDIGCPSPARAAPSGVPASHDVAAAAATAAGDMPIGADAGAVTVLCTPPTLPRAVASTAAAAVGDIRDGASAEITLARVGLVLPRLTMTAAAGGDIGRMPLLRLPPFGLPTVSTVKLLRVPCSSGCTSAADPGEAPPLLLS